MNGLINPTCLALLILTLTASILPAQDFLNITPIIVQGDGLTKAKVMTTVGSSDKFFSTAEMQTLNDRVKQYNAEIDQQVQKTIEGRQQLVDIRQRLLQQRDNAKLVSQLAEAEASYAEILADIKKNLEGVAYKGFYICAIKNISPLDNPDKLIDKAKAQIAPVASMEVLGFFIQSVTELYRREGFDDKLYSYIREEVSGRLEVETKYHHVVNPAERIFWYACKVTVSPLREKVVTKTVAVEEQNPNIIVVNALKDPDIQGQLTSKGVSRAIAADITAVVEANRLSVVSENSSIKIRESNIIRSGQQKLVELDEKIKAIKRRIEQAHVDIKRLVEGNTNVKYNNSSMVNSIDAANKALLARIKTLVDEELSLRERKLQTEWDRPLATSGDPKEAISGNVVELKDQFETNYGKIEQFIEIAELENDNLTVSQGRKVTYQRKVERMWIFLEPQSAGFKLHVVARFRIAGTSLSTSSTTTQQPTGRFASFTETATDLNFEMVAVRGGTFQMGDTFGDGDDDEKPVHSVTVSDFFMGKYEVTQAQWRAVMGSNPSRFSGCDNCPVEQVSWNDIQEFLKKLNQKTGKTYRLPTEAEWEYAAKGGASTGSATAKKYAGSNSIDEVAWYDSNSSSKTHPVGGKRPNELGIYDMTGNVWEWCADWFGKYSSGSQTNPQGATSGSYRVYRGGSWNYNAEYGRVSIRNSNFPEFRYNYLGFRLCLTP